MLLPPTRSDPARHPFPRTVAGYVLHFTGRHQAGLAALSVVVFALSAVPLELQRRIINAIVERGALATVVTLGVGYAVVALADQSLKLCLNVYRGWVAESTVRRLRSMLRARIVEIAVGPQSTGDAGVEIAMMLDEAEPIGGFTGLSVSEPLLQGGILMSVVGYMLYLEPLLALLGLAFFLPQLVFVPWIQGAINHRAQARILTKREISGTLVESVAPSASQWRFAGDLIEQIFALNMGIYRLKYLMNLLMNLMHHLGVAAALGVGGWLALEGRIEVGTVVAVVGGLGKLNDPWGDLVNWARELSVVSVKYRLFTDAAARIFAPRATPT